MTAMKTCPIRRSPWMTRNYLNGFMMARCRSTAIAVNVNTETLTLTNWTYGQNVHMNSGRFHRCSTAAWNWESENAFLFIVFYWKMHLINIFPNPSSYTWNGIANMPMMTSARARFAINRLVTDCICRVVATIHMTRELPITARTLMVP